MIKNCYYYFQSAVSPDVCKKIIDLGYKEKIEKSKTNLEIINKEKTEARKSFSCGLNEQWIYDLLYPYLNEANKGAGWNFDTDWSESLQFTVYKTNNYYSWHRDSGIDESYIHNSNQKNINGKIRKISMTLLLNDGKDFKGGDLQFDMGRNDMGVTKKSILTCKEARFQGSIIFFPSFIHHRVSPVTKGTRYSLVMWTLGKPFR